MPAQATAASSAHALAAALMLAFAERTGLSSQVGSKRYLWTDAFAVCTFLALARTTGDARFSALAATLVEQVHRVLGRHRNDDPRSGWISGLDDAVGEVHPTVGGLRIGKPLPERGAEEPYDAELEWERDGQYFHYLTRWMHALDQFAHATGQLDAERWARELAVAAVAAFTLAQAGSAPLRLAWKMSIDLGRPQVASTGQHDALDGLVTCLQLQARRIPENGRVDLADMIGRLAPMALAGTWRTDDPLGLGGLLHDAWRLAQLPGEPAGRDSLVQRLLEDALGGIAAYARQRPLLRPLGRRLAFRELGLAIGLHAAEHLQAGAPRTLRARVTPHLGMLREYLPLAAAIEAAWCDASARQAATWRSHEDINAVMLATSLVPIGYLDFM